MKRDWDSLAFRQKLSILLIELPQPQNLKIIANGLKTVNDKSKYSKMIMAK